MFASIHNKTETVKLLIDKGANVNAVNKKGDSVLLQKFKDIVDENCYIYDQCITYIDIIKLLIKAGAEA